MLALQSWERSPASSMTLVKHLERHLGTIAEGWIPTDTTPNRVQVVRFPNQPMDGVSTFATLGLSETILPMPSGRHVRLELLVSVRDSFHREHVASFLETFSEYLIGQQRALVRGDVVGPATPLIPGVRACAVLASLPVLFVEELEVFEGVSPPVVIVWLVPLTQREAEWTKRHGWDALEELLERDEVDFYDLNRPTLAAIETSDC